MESKSYEFLLRSKVEDIDFINKIMEAYEGVGVVRTLDSKTGLLSIVLTEDFKDFVREMLEDLGKNGFLWKSFPRELGAEDYKLGGEHGKIGIFNELYHKGIGAGKRRSSSEL